MPITEGLTSRKTCIGPPKQGYAEKRRHKKTAYAVALKYDPHQLRDKEGQWTTGGGGGGTGSEGGKGTGKSKGSKGRLNRIQLKMQAELAQQNKKPVHVVKTAEEAVGLVLQGKRVEIQDTKDVHTVLKLLGEFALAAKAQKKNAPGFDPCNVTVKGVSLFCSEKLKTKEFPHGIPRIEMPQFKSKNPTPGSEADKLPRDESGEVDGSQQFLKHLQESGVKTDPHAKVPARKLKASQAEMEGAKVAGMMLNPTRDPKKAKIWVSKDNYVIDGHHTWAAAIGRDAEDGNLDNDMEMEVVRVDMLMADVYELSVPWTRRFGLPSAGVKKRELARILAYGHA